MHTRTVVLIGLLTVLGFALEPVGAGHASDSEATAYIVGFHELPNDRARYQGGQVTSVDDTLSFFVVETHDAQGFERRVKQDDRALYLELDHNGWELSLTPDDALYADAGHYGTKITNTESAWDVTTGSTAVVVAMIDSGIARSHEDIDASRVLQGWDYVNGDDTPEDTTFCSYHGSHTAGTAGATANNGVGVAGMSQHTILPLKIFHGENPGRFGCTAATTSQIAQAIKDAADAGAHVSSNSWGGGGSSTTLNNAIAYAHDKGTIHVAAAGNSGTCTDCVGQPWKDNPAKTVIVTCSDETDGFCSFSSQGPEVDLIAPGDDILSVDGGGGYRTMSGTSMSTPHVAGAVALYIAANGPSTFATVENALKTSADDIGHSVGRQGGGRLNTGAFLGASGGTTNSPPTASFTHACTDLSCDFDGTGSSDSDGTIASYAWDFGDGATATGATPSHSYATAGDYTVTLTVTDDAGATDSETQTVSVSDSTSNTAPTADFTYTCTDLSCDFDGTSSSDPDSDTLSYAWDLGDGTTATGPTVSHTYASGGDSTVTLTVDDGNGGSDSTAQVVSVSSSTASGIHVGDLDVSGTSGKGGDWTATVTVLVHDENHTGEDGSTVSLDYQGSKSATGSVSCTTDSSGTCTVSKPFANRESPVDFTVTGISDSDGAYDASSNHDPDGDSDGTTITVSKR